MLISFGTQTYECGLCAARASQTEYYYLWTNHFENIRLGLDALDLITLLCPLFDLIKFAALHMQIECAFFVRRRGNYRIESNCVYVWNAVGTKKTVVSIKVFTMVQIDYCDFESSRGALFP